MKQYWIQVIHGNSLVVKPGMGEYEAGLLDFRGYHLGDVARPSVDAFLPRNIEFSIDPANVVYYDWDANLIQVMYSISTIGDSFEVGTRPSPDHLTGPQWSVTLVDSFDGTVRTYTSPAWSWIIATIPDDESPGGPDDPPMIHATPVNGREGERVGFDFTLSEASTTPVSFSFRIAGTADASDDVQGPSEGEVVFAPGSTRVQLRWGVVDDNKPETTESLSLILSNTQNGVLSTNSIASTILDNDESSYAEVMRRAAQYRAPVDALLQILVDGHTGTVLENGLRGLSNALAGIGLGFDFVASYHEFERLKLDGHPDAERQFFVNLMDTVANNAFAASGAGFAGGLMMGLLTPALALSWPVLVTAVVVGVGSNWTYDNFLRGIARDGFGQMYDDLQSGRSYPLIDGSAYLRANPDVDIADVDYVQHYMNFGWHEGRNPSKFFYTDGYLAANPDVASAGVNPLEHYSNFGWKEGRDPSLKFDTSDYLARNPDVAAAGINPLEHYLVHGRFEGRTLGSNDDWF